METRRKWPILLALILAMLGALSGGSGHIAVAGVAPALASNPIVYAVEVDRVSAPQTFGASAVKTDGAGDLFTAAIIYTGNDTEARVNKRDPTGAIVGSWPVLAPPPQTGYDKLDSVSLSASGTALLVEGTSHLTSNRDYLQSVATIPGVYVPFNPVTPEDGSGAYIPPGCPIPQGLSDGDVQRIVDGVAARLQPQFDGVIGSIKPQVEGLFNGSAGSYIVYQQLVNTSYTGALSALRAPTPRP